MCVLRAMPLALGSLLAAFVAHAQNETVPAIFSDVFAPGQSRIVPKLEAPEIVRSRLPLSPQVRMALNERATVAIAHAPKSRRARVEGPCGTAMNISRSKTVSSL